MKKPKDRFIDELVRRKLVCVDLAWMSTDPGDLWFTMRKFLQGASHVVSMLNLSKKKYIHTSSMTSLYDPVCNIILSPE